MENTVDKPNLREVYSALYALQCILRGEEQRLRENAGPEEIKVQIAAAKNYAECIEKVREILPTGQYQNKMEFIIQEKMPLILTLAAVNPEEVCDSKPALDRACAALGGMRSLGGAVGLIRKDIEQEISLTPDKVTELLIGEGIQIHERWKSENRSRYR